MDYPNDFDTPSFPADRVIALSRRVSIWISCCFLLIICLCCFLLYFWSQKSNYPFLISIDPITDEWTVVAHPGKAYKDSVKQYKIIQEKLVDDFVKNWFTISPDKNVNESLWKTCSEAECSAPVQFNPDNVNCALFCACDKKVFTGFLENVVPEYKARIEQRAENWTVIRKHISADNSFEQGGIWRVSAAVLSSVNGIFNVLIFITVDRAPDLYPATMGYYVKDFNAYRVSQ